MNTYMGFVCVFFPHDIVTCNCLLHDISHLQLFRFVCRHLGCTTLTVLACAIVGCVGVAVHDATHITHIGVSRDWLFRALPPFPSLLIHYLYMLLDCVLLP